jgi:hypothetical protein
LEEVFESGLVLAVRLRPVVLAGFLEELAASLRQGDSDSFLFADDLDPERLVPENLSFALCNGKRFAWTLAHRFSISSAIAIPLDVVRTFFVEFGPAIDQDVVWPNAAVACVNDWAEAPLLRRGAAQLHVLREIDAPRMGLAGSHHRTSKSGLEKLCANGNSVKFFGHGLGLAICLGKIARWEKTMKCGLVALDAWIWGQLDCDRRALARRRESSLSGEKDDKIASHTAPRMGFYGMDNGMDGT